ncbi:spore germination protein [Gorillibacterium timonense]|uniref:spore germination protein n=1 Tax=Gorillibacterium timonense TaxID=1689269 RepID=UPI00071C2265|nr:spore germination protein [Gorillibacterium timonense]
MPSLVIGGIKINSVASGSNVQIGDTGFINLSSNCKIFAGADSFSPGDSFFSTTAIGNGSTNTIDPDIVDTPNANQQI